MLNRISMNIASTQSAELMKYCKIENVSLESMLYAEKLQRNMRFTLVLAALRLLRYVDKVLHTAINRLSVMGEHGSMAQRQPS